jgi:hypothetical protein
MPRRRRSVLLPPAGARPTCARTPDSTSRRSAALLWVPSMCLVPLIRNTWGGVARSWLAAAGLHVSQAPHATLMGPARPHRTHWRPPAHDIAPLIDAGTGIAAAMGQTCRTAASRAASEPSARCGALAGELVAAAEDRAAAAPSTGAGAYSSTPFAIARRHTLPEHSATRRGGGVRAVCLPCAGFHDKHGHLADHGRHGSHGCASHARHPSAPYQRCLVSCQPTCHGCQPATDAAVPTAAASAARRCPCDGRLPRTPAAKKSAGRKAERRQHRTDR